MHNTSDGEKMENLEEAKEIMQAAGCIHSFPIYDLDLHGIAEIKQCHDNGESIELSKDIQSLVPSFSQTMVINAEKPITCPLDSSYSKYLEFLLQNKQINAYNLNSNELEEIKIKIISLLTKYNWVLSG
jgi:hypothetical protein